MRKGRLKGDPEAEATYYHCISRIVDRRFVLDAAQKEIFVRIMRGYETYCGVQIITFCLMSNHFHILLRVPRRPSPERLPSDAELVDRLRAAGCSYGAHKLAQHLETFRSSGHHQAAEELRERFFSTMWDVSYFMRVLKQRFSQWYNGRHDRKGTLWEERFRSVLIEAGPALWMVAWYIDLNPVRAGIVKDPKDYRWCGFAEAVAGVGRAREAIAFTMEGYCSKKASLGQRLAAYRLQLFEVGGVSEGEGCSGNPRTFSMKQLQSVRSRRGKLDTGDPLRHRVRYFTEGLVLGSSHFVEHYFQRYRDRFGRYRIQGARPVQGIASFDLHSLIN